MNELRDKIRKAASGNRNALYAETFLGNCPGFSKAVKLQCSDSLICIAKGNHLQKPIVSEHIVGRLGGLLQAPVAKVEFIVIPDTLLQIEPNMKHFTPGLAHANIFIKDCSEKSAIDHTNISENRSRFALLSVLFSWVGANDPQCIYKKTPPNFVYSVDHGHFFPSGPKWSKESLRTNIDNIQLDPWFNTCGLTDSELALASKHLQKITDEDIELIVKGPPTEWGISSDERDALTKYLIKRKAKLIEILP